MGNNGKLQEYKILVMGSPNQEPKLVSMKDLDTQQLQRIVANGTERLYELKAEVESLMLDLEAARMEAAQRGWITDEGHEDKEGTDLRTEPGVDGEPPAQTPG